MITTNVEDAIIKPDVFESKKIRLTSPILHIGSQFSQLNPFEYVQTGSRVYIPNPDLLAKALYQRGRLQEYINRIEDRQEIYTLLEDTFGDNWRNQKLDGKPLFPETGISRKWTEDKITNFRPMIRNGLGEIYLPGTSIKGAIRTAVAYHLLEHPDKYKVPQKKRVSAIEKQLKNSMGELRRKAKFRDDRLFMDSLFSDFSLYFNNQKADVKSCSANTDFMRAVQVTDSQPLLEFQKVNKKGKTLYKNLAVAAKVIVSSRFEDYNAKYRESIYAEMVWNVKTEFTISINSEMLSWFRHNEGMKIPFNNVEDLLNICREFAQDQWNAEVKYWEKIGNNTHRGENLDFDLLWENYYEKPNCPYDLRIGWGTSILGTTISMLYEDENLAGEVRDICHPNNKAPGFEAPKSRRVVLNNKGEIRYVPGWVNFEVL
jgi:CRISPR-associated protein Csm5